MSQRFVLCLVLAASLLIMLGTGILKSQSPLSNGAVPWIGPGATSTGNERLLLSQGTNAVGANQIVLVDATKQVMAVYWIAPDTGVIQLKSVRNILADLQLEEFNGTDPSPSKVRSILGSPK